MIPAVLGPETSEPGTSGTLHCVLPSPRSSLSPSPAWGPRWSHPPASSSSLLHSPGKALLTCPAASPRLSPFWWPRPASLPPPDPVPSATQRLGSSNAPSSLSPSVLSSPRFILPTLVAYRCASFPSLPIPQVLRRVCLWSLSAVFLSLLSSHVHPARLPPASPSSVTFMFPNPVTDCH